MMRKICAVITARPSYSRIKTALRAIDKHPDLELQLVVAASALLNRYGNAARYIEADGFNITARVHMVLEGENLMSMAKTTGLGLLELSSVFNSLKPDIIVTIADRFETISTAISSAYMNIPLAHIQGGEVTGNIDEKTRHAVTKLADLHFVSNKNAHERLIKMGEVPETIFNTGCPSIDIAHEILQNPELDFNPLEKYGGVGADINLDKGYIVAMQHPVTTEYQLAREHVTTTLEALDALDQPILWFWPNIDAGSDGTSKGIRVFREMRHPQKIRFFKNMEPSDFLRVLYNSKGLIGNSSVGIRECSYLGVPVVNIGSRQSGRDRGQNVIDVDYEQAAIREAISYQLTHGRYESDLLYGDGYAGEKIANILAEAPLSIDKKLTY